MIQIKGTEKLLERMKKAREDAEFKKRMTERSTFSATVGIQKAKQVIKKGTKYETIDNFVNPTEIKNTYYTSFGKVDGS